MEETALPVYFGEWLKRRRKQLDLTQEELARRADCSVFALRKIESGERRPSKQLAGLIARSLGIPVEEQANFIRVARGELNLERLSSPDGAPSTRGTRDLPPVLPTIRLPVMTTPFIGREPELAGLSRMLQDPRCRLLTITGHGGIGKSRLAIEVASRDADQFSDGVFFVPLAALNSSAFLVPAIADALSFRFGGKTEPRLQLLGYLGDRKLLLVLDNAEHLLDEVGLFLEILEHSQGVKLLVTSHERLNLLSEWVFEIQGLEVPPIEGDAPLGTYSSVALFLQSARRVRADFNPVGEEQLWMRRICRMMEGMPLGIELAAAWVGMLTCEEIAREIERNLDFLSVSMRDLPERHRSLRAMLDHSWNLLGVEEKAVLRRLAVFRGGFRREAAQEVAGATLALLSALMSKSFLHKRTADRFDLHEIIRQYGLEKLKASGLCEATFDRHLAYLVALAEQALGGLRGPQQSEWFNRLEEELDNMRAAMSWSFGSSTTPERVECGLKLIITTTRFWQGRGLFREAVQWLERGLQADASISPKIRANALSTAGWLLTWDDCLRARTMLQESIALYRQLNDEPGLARGLDILGDITWYYGDFATARASYEESLALFRKHGDPCNIGLSLYSAGRLYVDYGYFAEAEVLLNEGLSLLQSIPDWRGIAMSLNGLGRLALLQGDLETALMHFCEALRLNKELGHKLAMTECLQELAVVALKMGQESRAIQLLSAATMLREDLGISFASNDPVYQQVSPAWYGKIKASKDWVEGRSMSLEQAVTYALCV